MPTTVSPVSPPAPGEAAAPRLIALFCRIRPERIGRLRDILEGYDGLAFLSSLDPASGLARLYVPAGSYADLLVLLESLAPGLNPWTQEQRP